MARTGSDGVELSSVGGVPTAPVEEAQPKEGRPVKKVGFIVNDTIPSAIEQAEKMANLLAGRGVEVFESHSASPAWPESIFTSRSSSVASPFISTGSPLRRLTIRSKYLVSPRSLLSRVFSISWNSSPTRFRGSIRHGMPFTLLYDRSAARYSPSRCSGIRVPPSQLSSLC